VHECNGICQWLSLPNNGRFKRSSGQAQATLPRAPRDPGTVVAPRGAARASPPPPAADAAAADAAPPAAAPPAASVRQLVMMGFPEERAREALHRTARVEEAVAWLLEEPLAGGAAGPGAGAPPRRAPPALPHTAAAPSIAATQSGRLRKEVRAFPVLTGHAASRAPVLTGHAASRAPVLTGRADSHQAAEMAAENRRAGAYCFACPLSAPGPGGSPAEDFSHWAGVICGPQDSPYAGGAFELDIRSLFLLIPPPPTHTHTSPS